MKQTLVRLVGGAALACAAMSANALTLNLTGYANGSANTTVMAPVPNSPITTNAGAFVGNITAPDFAANPFYTYCVQLTQSFGFGSLPNYSIEGGASYFGSVLPTLPSNGTVVADRLGKLFTYLGGIGMPSSATQSAAIQLAVWESIYEGASALTVSSGLFTATNTAGAVITAANAMLAGASALTTSVYHIKVLKNADLQDFILVVPEPASLALVALALSGLALSRRRRQAP